MLLDLREVTRFTDYFVIASVSSPLQFEALIQTLKKLGPPETGKQEGSAESGWVLIDYGDVVVHLFGLHERSYYNLEGLWAQSRELLRIE